MRTRVNYRWLLCLVWISTGPLVGVAEEYEALPEDPYFEGFQPLKAPESVGMLLRVGDRLAICGDSITEQKMYSRIMETYLTVCAPQLGVSVRQHGWSGERAPGLLGRMDHDVLRFGPTIATTCYAMNDHAYQPYQEELGATYRDASAQIIEKFKAAGIRVIQGAAGPVGKMPSWVREARGTVKDLNLSLCRFRNIDIELAQAAGVGFADVFLPMLVQGHAAQREFGAEYMISGKDGVHPGWAGHLLMAHSFLKAMGLNGEIGRIVVDLGQPAAFASEGHTVLSVADGAVELESTRYPFCATGALDADDSIRSGMALIGFNDDLNRLILVVENAPADRMRVTWGETDRVYSAEELAAGVNLADDFEVNPFSAAFGRVDEAIGRKQAYETRQMKDLFHGAEGHADMERTVELTELVRESLVKGVAEAFVPVRHTLRLTAE